MSKGRLWTYDELLVACYFYIRHGAAGRSDSRLQEMAIAMNRTVGSIQLRLENFKAVDPAYTKSGRVGMRGGLKQCAPVFRLWIDSEQDFLIQASHAAMSLGLAPHLDDVFPHPLHESLAATEGARRLVQHLKLERSSTLPQLLKSSRMSESGKLACEACDFDFEATYGAIGHGFIEAHHKVPLKDLEGPVKTTLEDLILVCSNCHRMLHRPPYPSVIELRSILSS